MLKFAPRVHPRIPTRANSTLTTQLKATNTLKKPHFDLQYYYDHYDLFRDICQKREVLFTLSKDYRESYDKLGALKTEILTSKQKLNRLSKQIKAFVMEEKQTGANHTGQKVAAAKLVKQMKEPLVEKIEESRQIEDTLTEQASMLPNLIHSSVAPKQTLVRYLNPTPALLEAETDDYPLTADPKRDHKDIMERLGLVDFKEATRVCGRGWYYLKGDAALLEQALVQYALKLARKSGFEMIVPPSMIKTEVTNACGFRPRDQNNEKQVYELAADADEPLDGRLCMTGTAEIALAGLFSNQTLQHAQLPIHYAGVSRSYRAEAGAAGRDTRGLYRVHEFTKVELFAWTEEDEEVSMKQFEQLAQFQMNFIESLGLTARVLVMPFNDLGAPAYKKIDIEALMPGRGAWGELSSVSNCLDYQSRRLSTQYKDPQTGKLRYVHTLNATACAVPRVILAIVENFYDAETDTILIPEVLRPFMDDKERIARR